MGVAKKSSTASAAASAAAALRRALGDTQQAFASRLGIAVRSVARYDAGLPPKGKALVKLSEVAGQAGYPDMASVFDAALNDELGIPDRSSDAYIGWLQKQAWFDSRGSSLDESLLTKALLKILREARYRKQRADLLRTLAQPAREVQQEHRQAFDTGKPSAAVDPLTAAELDLLSDFLRDLGLHATKRSTNRKAGKP